MVFRKGHRIRLDIQPRDGVGSAAYMHYHADYNTGTNTIYAGGERESYLLLPIIPTARDAASESRIRDRSRDDDRARTHAPNPSPQGEGSCGAGPAIGRC